MRKSIVARAVVWGVAVWAIAAPVGPRASAQLGVRWVLNEVTADFAVSAGHPLVKGKFNLYDPVGPSLEQFNKNVKLLRELNVDTYRIEIAWGRRRTGIGTHTQIGGTPDALTYDFGPLDHIVRELKKEDVLLLGAYSYTPTPLQNPDIFENRDSYPPTSIAKWKEVVRAFAQHHRDAGLPFGVHEIWNEPDGRVVFFSGKEADYQEMYRAAVEAIRSVDPDAVISGPASAPGLIWITSFPEFVARNKLPLDVLSYHAYGSGELALEYTDTAMEGLSRFPSLETTELSLNEWHHADCCQWCFDDSRHRYEAASQLLHDFNLFLTRPELTSVSWAWFQDPNRSGRGGPPARGGEVPAGPGCMGLVSGSGQRKAVFNAWKVYASMPVDRKQVKVRGSLEAMASSDTHKASVVAWNRDPYDRWISGVHLKNPPFQKGNVRIYKIDATHASAGDGADELLTSVETFNDVNIAEWTWKGALPRGGTIYFEAEDGSGLSELTPAHVGKVVRINRHFPSRGRTDSYADFSRKTWIARLGMMKDAGADQKIGVLAEGLPDSVGVTVDVDGQLQKLTANSLLGVRVDYRVNGQWVKGVLFHGPHKGIDLFDRGGQSIIPWALAPKAEAVGVADFAEFALPLKNHAPAGWAGTAHLTFLMQSAGAGARAKFTVRKDSK